MTWIDTDFIGSINTKNAEGIQIQVKGNEYEVLLEKMSLHSPNSLHLIFRGYKDKFGVFMRRLKAKLPESWIETIDDGMLVNINNAIGVRTSTQGVQLEFETNAYRAPLRTIFQGDEKRCAAFLRRLKLPESWIETIDDGMLVNINNAIGVRTSTQGVQLVQVVVDVQRENNPLRTVFRSESEGDCKAFLDDLTAALLKGATA